MPFDPAGEPHSEPERRANHQGTDQDADHVGYARAALHRNRTLQRRSLRWRTSSFAIVIIDQNIRV